MLSTWEAYLYSASTLILVPLVVYALIARKKPPETWASKYYRAEKYLYPVSNLFLVVVCASGIGRLLVHSGLIGVAANDVVRFAVGVPFMLVLLVDCFLWARAYLKVRLQARSLSSPDPT